MAELRYGVIGTGFWSRYQIAAWREVGGARLAALCNRTVAKAEVLADELARQGDKPAVYGDPEKMLQKEHLDGVDVHAPLVQLGARYKVPVICQKPMAPDLATAESMVRACRQAGIPFFVHENWRWQTPIRALKQALDEGHSVHGSIGRPYRARLDFITGFHSFQNQPFLKTLRRFIIADMGSHLFDVARFLFGEADSLYCQTRQVHKDIAGEDVATVLLGMGGVSVVCEMSTAENYLERDPFPQSPIFIEGEQGSLELAPDYWLRLTTEAGTFSHRVPPPRYAWANPAYEVVHASIVPCNANLLAALKGEGKAETTGEDNLETMRLVFAAYDSAESGEAVVLRGIRA